MLREVVKPDYRRQACDTGDLPCCARRCGRGRWSGYPFYGPRSRADIAARAGYRIYPIVGAQSLWQPRIGPAPGHPDHLPNKDVGARPVAQQNHFEGGGGACRRRHPPRLFPFPLLREPTDMCRQCSEPVSRPRLLWGNVQRVSQIPEHLGKHRH